MSGGRNQPNPLWYSPSRPCRYRGLQRTRQEYKVLFEHAGFSFQRAIDTGADTTILEAIPA